MKAFEPLALGPITLKNRFVKTATFEGMSPGGVVSDALVEHHGGMARAGVALTTVAYGAVEALGRTFGQQLLVTREAGLERIAQAVHEAGGAVSLQLAHAGGFSKLARPPLGPSPGWNLYGITSGAPRVRAMTEADMGRTRQAFVTAAEIARDAGFDAVELHCGHGYLLSQFLSPVFNLRRDAWGGSLDARLRFPLSVARAVVEAVGDDVAVIAKTNLDDGVDDGATIDDAVVIAQALEDAGVHGIVPSGGLVQRSAFYLMRGGIPIARMAAAESTFVDRLAMRAFAPFVVKPYRYEPAFFAELGARVRDAVRIPVGLLGGVDGVEVVEHALDDGFAFVTMGRALLADPDFLERMQAGERFTSRCTHCNECVAVMNERGVACTLPPR